jgi:hypothetical protein
VGGEFSWYAKPLLLFLFFQFHRVRRTFLSRRACYRLLITSINTAGGGYELNRPLGGVAPAPGPGRHVPCGAPNGCGAGAVRAQISRTSAERLRE